MSLIFMSFSAWTQVTAAIHTSLHAIVLEMCFVPADMVLKAKDAELTGPQIL